jgi:formylglycine-generating enzyme required for sulfatase activity
VEEDLDLGSGVSMTMVLVPPGTFKMGSSAAEIKEAMRQFDLREEYFKDELPSHDVEITRPFLMGKYEVTKRQFGRFVAADGYKTEAETDGEGGYGYDAATNKFEGRKPIYNWKYAGFPQTDEHPVVNVSWNDAEKFTIWLRGKTQRNCSLPSEAQWEYACRACTTTLFVSGNDGETLAQVGNVADGTAKKKFTDWSFTIKAEDGYVFTAPGGRFRANPLGLHDLHGNIWEWCEDWYDEKYYANSPRPDPLNEQKASSRVVRGGSWNFLPGDCRAAYRNGSSPDYRNGDLGFRVVVPAPSRTQ